jgi:hypothetical protein
MGIVWGSGATDVDLEISFGGRPFEPVARCSPLVDAVPWSLWEHFWTQPGEGEVAIRLRVADATVRTRRLDTGYYERVVRL